MEEDIVQELRDFAYITNETQNVARLVMLNGDLFDAAADVIESQQQKINIMQELLHDLADICDHKFLDHNSYLWVKRSSETLKRYNNFAATLKKEELDGNKT